MSGRGAPETLRAAWDAVAGDPSLTGGDLRRRLVDVAESWLAGLWTAAGGERRGVALVALGSLGRADLVPGSDLDLLLLTEPDRDVTGLAERLWYPLWDAKVGLDHAVRTVAAARRIAEEDLRAALGLLDARHLAGDAALTESLRRAVYEDWRRGARTRLPRLREAAEARAAEHGELAFLLEPNLRDARGGLRDVLAIRAAAATWAVDAPGERVQAAYRWLLDVRGELHRRAGRAADRLVMQEQAPVAAALRVDVDELCRRTSRAGRVVAYALDETWRRAEPTVYPAPRWPRRRRPGPALRPLDDGVVEAGGEVTLLADPDRDPALVLRVAAAAAQHALPIASATLTRLAASPAALPDPWPDAARAAFLSLLEAGTPAVAVVEALDQADLWQRVLPEWELVRFRAQHNPVHRHTVDRHLVQTVAEAAAYTREVERPDLLVLTALLHDIGKGVAGEDHALAGAGLVPPILRRMGLPEPDVDTVTALVRHHLLLAETAVRRDPDDPATVATVAEAVGSRERLELLHALTRADAIAAGPAAWSAWKAGLVARLADRVRAVLGGETLSPNTAGTDLPGWAGTAGEVEVAVEPGVASSRVTVVAPDTPGLLWRWAGVLTLHRLEILAATAGSARGPAGDIAVTTFDVRPRYGELPDPAILRQDLRRAVEDPAGVEARIAERERFRRPDVWSRLAAPPRVLWVDDASARASVVEVRAHDSAGLLSRLARVLTEAGLTVVQARIQTLGAEVVDVFYVTTADGQPLVDPGLRSRLEPRLLAACLPAGADRS